MRTLNTLYPLDKQSFKAFLGESFRLQNLGLASNERIANLDEFDFSNSIIYATNADREDFLKPSESTAHKNLAFSLVEVDSHKKADLIKATRAINRAIPSYNIIFFLSPTHLSIAFATRRFHKSRTIHTDIVEKITLIKDIDLANPSQAHTRNLDSIAKITPKEVDNYYREILEALSISALNKEFYAKILVHFADFVENLTLPNAQTKATQNDTTQKREFILRLLSRILFCKFLEKKGIISPNLWDTNLSTDYYHEVLEPLFFTTLNTPQDSRDYGFLPRQIIEILSKIPYLNGGLFSPQISDYFIPSNPHAYANALKIDNTLFDSLFATLDAYHFTIDEANESAEEVALDPELLGQIFESLLSQLFTDNKLDKLDKNSLRKETGSYYTPREIVRYMVRSAILIHLQTHLKGKVDSQVLDSLIFSKDSSAIPTESKQIILDRLSTLKILDPACGSGAFPMGILSEIIALQDLLGDLRPHYARKLEILQSCIYGIDIQPMATEIARLRCFLSLVVDENPSDIKSLPNLEFKFISANSLLPLPKDDTLQYDGYVRDMAELDRLRIEYFNPDSSESKAQIQKSYTILRTKIANKVSATNAQDALQNPLLGYDPFDPHTVAQFFDSTYMFGVESFDIVIGNPPYIRQESIPNKQAIIQSYKSINFLGKNYAFSCSTADIYTYFFAKGAMLLSHKGNLIFITSNKFCRAGYGKNLREFLLGATIQKYVDLNGVKVFDNATVDSCILQICKEIPKDNMIAYATPTKKDLSTLAYSQIPQDSLSSEAFIFADSPTLALKQKIEQIGTPLKEWDIEINYGIKTGYNEAFIIDTATKDRILADCDDTIKSPLPCGGGLGVGNLTERERTAQIIKPILRGRDIKRYSYEWANLWLIGTFPALKLNIDDYPALKKYLESFMPRIAQNGEKGCRKKTSNKWFETQDNIAYYEDFEKEKIVYPNMNKEFLACYDTHRFYTNQKCFIVTSKSENLKYLTGIFNSKTNFWYFRQIGATLGANGYEMSKIFVEKIPIPKINTKNQKIADKIVNLVDKVLESKKQGKDSSQSESQIDDLVYQLYELDSTEIQIIEK